jgi:VanZ family protein
VHLRRASLALAAAWMALLFYLSHQPGIPVPELFPHQDKLLHATAFGVLAALSLMAMPLAKGGYSWRQVGIAVLIASLYGISDEVHQYFIPGRHADSLDWLADTAGALLGALVVARLSHWSKQKSPLDQSGP